MWAYLVGLAFGKVHARDEAEEADGSLKSREILKQLLIGGRKEQG
jgi:hypothetical protein